MAQFLSPANRRLWIAAVAMALCISIIAVRETIQRAKASNGQLSLGHDLLPSYTAGRLLRANQSDGLYDAVTFTTMQQRVMNEARLFGDARLAPYVNPPFYAWLFVPFAALPYRTAAAIFLAVSLGLFAFSVALLCRMLPAGGGFRAWGLVPLIIVVSAPFWQAITHLQNSFISLAILASVVTLWRRGSGFGAGLVAGLLLFKPQLAAVVAAGLIVTLGWRALAGIAITTLAFLAITLVTMPGSLSSFVREVPSRVQFLQFFLPYNWSRQITLQSFWRMIVQENAWGETKFVVKVLWISSAGIIATGLAWVARIQRVRRKTIRSESAPGMAGRPQPVWAPMNFSQERANIGCEYDNLIAAALISMPLLMPYFMDYDLLLLSIAAVLQAAAMMRRTTASSLDRWITIAWISLFCMTIVNPIVADATRINGTVAALILLAGLSIARSLGASPALATIPSADAPTAGNEMPLQAA